MGKPLRVEVIEILAGYHFGDFGLTAAADRILDAVERHPASHTASPVAPGVPEPLDCVCGPEATCQFHQQPGEFFRLRAQANECVRCLSCKKCAATCDCTGGPQTEPECTCYELTGGHQPGCHFNRPRPSSATTEGPRGETKETG